MLTPLEGKDANMFWIGASYIWDFDNACSHTSFQGKDRTGIAAMAKDSFQNN